MARTTDRIRPAVSSELMAILKTVQPGGHARCMGGSLSALMMQPDPKPVTPRTSVWQGDDGAHEDAIMPNLYRHSRSSRLRTCRTIRQHLTRQLIDHRRPVGSKMADFLITESGFGADIGMEKFFAISAAHPAYSGAVVTA